MMLNKPNYRKSQLNQSLSTQIQLKYPELNIKWGQKYALIKHQWTRAQTFGADHPQPSRVEKMQISKEVTIPTVAESSRASRGGHPSRMIIRTEGDFPFTSFILETPLPDRWKMPVFDKYDGTTNPDTHLRTFSNQMMFHAVNDPIWCMVFSSSLLGKALEWFLELPPTTISPCWKPASTCSLPYSSLQTSPKQPWSTSTGERMNL